MWRFANFVSRGISQRIQDLAVRTPKEFSHDDDDKKNDKKNNSKEHVKKLGINKSQFNCFETLSPNCHNLNDLNCSSTTNTNSLDNSLKENESKINHMVGLSFLKDGNYIKALPWIKSSSELGNPKAQFNLALCYEQGLGVKQDLQKFYYIQSADAGHGSAQYNLGIFYANGLGGSPSISKKSAISPNGCRSRNSIDNLCYIISQCTN